MKLRVPNFVRSFSGRAYVLYAFFFVACYAVSGRLFSIQISGGSDFRARALSQQMGIVSLEPERGSIFMADRDGNLQPLAVNKRFIDVAVDGTQLRGDVGEAAQAITDTFNLNLREVEKKLQATTSQYILIKRHVPGDLADTLFEKSISGVFGTETFARSYPNGTLASHVVGFVNADVATSGGQYGLERQYDAQLAGKGLSAQQAQQALQLGSLWGLGSATVENGSDLILTIDPNVQRETERLLAEEVKKWNAKSGNAIVMDPVTGAIRALANYPGFDPNAYGTEKNLSVFMNGSVALRYEPGSVFKPFTFAGGLTSGAVATDTEYYDSGAVTIGDKTIQNAGGSKPGKMISMALFLQRSYNVGAVFIENAMGDPFFRDFITKTLRFQDKTGVDLPGEIASTFANFFPPEGRRINFANAAFGQGIALTPMKLIQEFAAFANHGTVMKPYVVAAIRDARGKLKTTVPQPALRTIGERVVDEEVPLLEGVVSAERGSGYLARIPGYRIAGKTGTGDIAKENGSGYYLDRINHTFVGFGPVSDPKLIILTRLEDPKGVRYAEATAVPLFRKIMKFCLDYYAIPTDAVPSVTPAPSP